MYRFCVSLASIFFSVKLSFWLQILVEKTYEIDRRTPIIIGDDANYKKFNIAGRGGEADGEPQKEGCGSFFDDLGNKKSLVWSQFFITARGLC